MIDRSTIADLAGRRPDPMRTPLFTTMDTTDRTEASTCFYIPDRIGRLACDVLGNPRSGL